MNTNQKAIDALENYEYEAALALFQRAVKESRTVQSLHNLAWMYNYEEEDIEKALELAEEVVRMNPTSHFPYNLLGEIYLKQKKWQPALAVLQKSISIQPSNEAYHHAAIVMYHLGYIEEASALFLKVAGDSDYLMYTHIKCLIECGRKEEAYLKLKAFSKEADEFVGEVDMADFFVEMDCFKEAINWFEKGCSSYSKGPYWISRFVYALFKVGNIDRAHEVLTEAIHQQNKEIKNELEEECEENWTEKDKEASIENLMEERKEYETIMDRISSGYIPSLEFEMAMTGGCYLFGCKRHNHPEYKE
ncbi:tetratricopeptide repeat protein [Domibacillus sp. A3M-37]|uniref:tetratricopeptide repeat protein n=1 Tax=Domibacillus sp. A3M-37 TaxID=2962037 RepID=UPI0020B6BDBB|nr:tetratricopeptide repeat protein [Domibacillus sp. A3M-37]MCP3764970.1 tetratricopeptide repeat protein [Domibacillus sp. A3M-37]